MLNPYQPISDDLPKPDGDVAGMSEPSPGRRMRLRVIPASLSWLVGALLFAGFVFWIVQATIAYTDHPFDAALWIITIGMAITLSASSALHVLAGFRWIKRRWLSAIALNAISVLLLFVAANRIQAFMETH